MRSRSRPGLKTRTRQLRASGRRGDAARRSRIGSAKAAVLPVPVCAMPTTSRAASTCGMVWAWIGVGVAYCSSLSARVMGSARPSSRKAVNAESFLWRGARLPTSGLPDFGILDAQVGYSRLAFRQTRRWTNLTSRVVWAVDEFSDEEAGRKPSRGIRSRDPWKAPVGWNSYVRDVSSTSTAGNYQLNAEIISP